MSSRAVCFLVLVPLMLGALGCGLASRVAPGTELLGYTFLNVDSTSYRPTVSRHVEGPSDWMCTREGIGRPESPYSSGYECNQAVAFYAREKGYLYRVRTPGDSLIYILSRARVASGHERPVPDTLVPPPPGPEYERIRLGATYRDLDLRPVTVQITELQWGPPYGQGPTQLIFEDEVSPEYAAQYLPLVSNALRGPYVRVGHAVGPVPRE